MLNKKSEILAFLNRDQLKHIVHLKMLGAYSKDIRSYYITHDLAEGILLLLPTLASPFDARAYPSTDYVVLLSTDNSSVTRKILDNVPTNCNLVFKLIDPRDKDVVEEQFKLERRTAFLSYTCDPSIRFAPASEVMVSDQLDEQLLPLFAQNGYDSEVVTDYFANRQGLSFAIYDSGRPVSAGLAFLNYGRIWEIGGLHTIPSARRKGLAKRIMTTALHTLQVNNYVPRYQMREDNPSKILIEMLGTIPVPIRKS